MVSFPGAEEPSELAQSLSQAALDEISGSTNMAEVTLALTSETDVRKLAGVILGKCRLLSHGDRSTLFLMDEEKRELVESTKTGEFSAAEEAKNFSFHQKETEVTTSPPTPHAHEHTHTYT